MTTGNREIRRIAVVGAGLMGHGIALRFALAGHPVRLNDLHDETLQNAMSLIRGDIRMLCKHGAVDDRRADRALSHVTTTAKLDEAAGDADLVIESISENLAQKRGLFERLDSLCPPHTILASNSSTFVPSRLASATGRPEQVVGTHFFNPPYLIPLVEIVRGPQTSEQTVTAVFDLMHKAGLSPVVVQREVPGFLANRIQAAVWREILSLVADGVATAQQIDQVMKSSIGRRWSVAGPFEITELSGLDLKQAIHAQLLPTLASSDSVPDVLKDKVERGELGVKTGKGFYDWTPERAQDLRDRIAHALTTIAQWEQQRSETSPDETSPDRDRKEHDAPQE